MSAPTEMNPAATAKSLEPVLPVAAELNGPQKKTSRGFTTAALMLLMGLASMEATVTTTAMPTIIGDLGGLKQYSLVMSVYLLASTLVMPLFGRLSDMVGRKKVITAAVGIFVVGSVLASVAQTMGQLVICRGIQGLGAGGIMPIVLTILGDIYTLKERARIQGLFSSVWGISALAGPQLGALLVDSWGWRSIFWVNLPFGLLGLLVLSRSFRDREKTHTLTLDIGGFGLLVVGSSALLVLIQMLGHWEFMRDPEMVGLLVGLGLVASLFLGWFVYHELRTKNPILPPKLLGRVAIWPCLVGSLLMGFCFLGLDTWVPLFVQGGQGGTAKDAANTVTPVMFCWALSAMCAAPLIVRWGFRNTSTLGACFIILGFAGLFISSVSGAPRWFLTVVLALSGLGFGPASISFLLGAQDAVDWQERGIITSAVTFGRNIGGAMGVGILGAIFNLRIHKDLVSLEGLGQSAAKLLDPSEQKQIPPEILSRTQAMICSGLYWLFGLMLLVALGLLIVARWIPRRRKPPAVMPGASAEADTNVVLEGTA